MGDPLQLQELRQQGEDLEPGERALALYQEILELDGDDVAAANMVGRSLETLGMRDEARMHWERMIEVQSDTRIAQGRLRDLRHRPRTPRASRAMIDRPRRAPAAVIEPILEGAWRVDCLSALAWSIRLVEQHDPLRLAVTQRHSDGRFRVSGGKASLVAPWRGMLAFFVHAPTVPDDFAATLSGLGGQVTWPLGGLKSLPDSVEYGIPYALVGELFPALHAAQREHVLRSIQVGPPPSGHLHDPDLRDYILDQAS